jgi:arylsulfatase A-like enzyme
MSLYGYARPTTPRLGSLAPEGAVFDHAYTSCPDEAAAIGSILSGRYPPEHGLLLQRHLRDSVKTLAESLKDAGYATHAITSEMQMSKESGLHQGFEEVEMIDPAESEELDGGAAAVTRRATAWIGGKRDREKPFFLVLVYSSAELPFHPPDKVRFKFVDPIVSRDRVDVVSEYWVPFAVRYNAHQAELSDREMDMLHDLYDAELLYVDDQIGEVVAALRSMNVLDATLLVETATRGEDLGEQHRLADVSSLRESNLRVPLLLRFPGHVPAGLKVEGLAQDVDLMPTILDLVGVARPATISRTAISLAPVGARTKRENSVSTAIRPAAQGSFDLLVSARDDRYRMLVSPRGSEGVFDLSADPEGLVDLSAKSGDVTQRLQRSLAEWDESLQAVPGAPPLPGPHQIAPGVPAPAWPQAPSKAGGARP